MLNRCLSSIGLFVAISFGLAFGVNAQIFDQQPANTENTAAQPQTYLLNPIISPSQMNTQKAEAASAQKIFLFIDNFKIESTPSGRVMCNLRLSTITTYKEGINTLNIKLKWPKMTTSAGFYDVNPNQETYQDMTLLGDGCYSMDKAPNIIVNTCRVKGTNTKDCAASVIWVKAK